VFSFAVIILELLTGKKPAALKTTFFDDEFCDELEAELAQRISPEVSRKIAQCLTPAFDPEPRKRPAAVKEWAEQIADLLD
jgi:hypothetical protein